MTPFMALDGVTLFLRLKDVTITCKRMRRSLSIGGSSSVQLRKVGRSWRLWMCFCRLLCVRIVIDQLQCVNCWIIIHCLSVSCTKINHRAARSWFDLLYNWPPNSELLFNNSLLELIYFLNQIYSIFQELQMYHIQTTRLTKLSWKGAVTLAKNNWWLSKSNFTCTL